MLKWTELTGQEVTFATDLVSSTVTYFRPKTVEDETGQIGGQIGGQKTYLTVLSLIKEQPSITRGELSMRIGIAPSAIQKHINYLKEQGYIRREGNNKSGYWKVLKDL
jgi:ATP-dependent DNA helicase RecG